MPSQTQQVKRIVRRQLFLVWIAVGSSWAYAFTLVGDASWNLSWTVILWVLFTGVFAFVGSKLLSHTEETHEKMAERIDTLEIRIEELESNQEE